MAVRAGRAGGLCRNLGRAGGTGTADMASGNAQMPGYALSNIVPFRQRVGKKTSEKPEI